MDALGIIPPVPKRRTPALLLTLNNSTKMLTENEKKENIL